MPANRLLEMESFLRVARHRNFSTAADEMGVSASLMTRRVQKLEAELSVHLVNRTTRNVSLTDTGRRYFAFCERILEEIRQEERTLRRLHDEPSGQLNVIAPMSFGVLEMGKAVTAFMAQYPEINISLIISDQWRSTFDPGHYGADVLIRFMQARDSGLFMRKLGQMGWVACATPEYLRKAGIPESPQQLKNHSCLCTTRPFTKGVWPFLGPKGRDNVRVSGLVAPSTAITMRYMALDNAGIALLPLFCVAEDIKQGRLVRILQDYKVPEQSISAYYPNSSQQTKIMKLFLNFLKDRFRTAIWASVEAG